VNKQKPSFGRKHDWPHPYVVLKSGRHASLERRHPWIFSGGIESVSEGLTEGDIVHVLNSEGKAIAVGHYAPRSIAVRLLRFDSGEINPSFWTERLRNALSTRQHLRFISPMTTSGYRLVNGEGDELSGLIIDMYEDVAVLQAHSVGMLRSQTAITHALREVMGDSLRGVFLQDRTPNALERTGRTLWGDSSPRWFRENGLQFFSDWENGQKTGFFLDQRENRSLVQSLASGRMVLNAFCYTGGFTLAAFAGGATSVTSVDASEAALQILDKNLHRNFPSAQHTSLCADCFEYLNQPLDQFDLVVLDPPAFAKSRSALRAALRGYEELNYKAIKHLKPGTLLFTFSCSQVVSPEQFQQLIFAAGMRARRPLKILKQLHQASCHPMNLFHPEGGYLKGLALEVGTG
jgi:23S rRNA (cytosine1962-C5)-methyltransferase